MTLYTLTPTQVAFLKLIAAGYTALEAGELISGNAETGRTHADQIRLRLNVPTIEAAVTLAHQFGYLDLNKIEVRLKDPSKPLMCDYPKH